MTLKDKIYFWPLYHKNNWKKIHVNYFSWIKFLNGITIRKLAYVIFIFYMPYSDWNLNRKFVCILFGSSWLPIRFPGIRNLLLFIGHYIFSIQQKNLPHLSEEAYVFDKWINQTTIKFAFWKHSSSKQDRPFFLLQSSSCAFSWESCGQNKKTVIDWFCTVRLMTPRYFWAANQ